MRHNIYFKYYVFSLLGVIFFLFLIKLKEQIRISLLISSASVVLSLYFVEFYLENYSNPLSLHAREAKSMGIEFDNRDKYTVYKDMLNQGLKVVPTVSPAVHLEFADNSIFPLGGISHAHTLFCNESGEYMTYKSDRFGFNNPDFVWNDYLLDFLLIGDSFTQGACVQSDENISSVIRQFGYKSLNIGNGGNGPLSELGSLIEYSKLIKPKNILWLYYEGNDIVNLNQEKESNLLVKYLNPKFNQDLANRQKEIDKYLDNKIQQYHIKNEGKDYLKFIKLTKLRALLSLDEQTKDREIYDTLFIEIILKAKKISEENGGNFYFVYLPEFSRYTKMSIAQDDYLLKERMISELEKQGVQVIDIDKILFSKYRDPIEFFPFKVPGHYTKEGYQKISQSIINVIKK